MDRSQAYSSYVPVALDTNREWSGASSAQSGSDTRGARKRFSQSGISSYRSGAADPLLSVMTPYCPSATTIDLHSPQPVDNSHRLRTYCAPTSLTPPAGPPRPPRTVEGVYRFLLTPRWWGINVFVLLAIPFCVFMGSWQLSRFEARVDDHRAAKAQAESAGTEAARPLARLLPVDKATSGKQATATGRYGTQLLVPDRELDGKNGFYVLTLLRTDGGKALPVVRGWLPGGADSAKVPAPPAGEVTVTGALQASSSPATTE